MSEHVFSDPDRQLIVRLTEERLSYEPVAGRGWQCRVADICWTSSRISSRGIQEVSLHGVDGRVVVTVLPFEGIERFYLTLLRQMAARPLFDSVRDSIPTQVPLLERMLRLGDATPEAERPWEFFRAAEGGAVAATPHSVLLSLADGSVERIPWSELAGIRSRGGVTRFFTRSGFTEVPVPDLEVILAPLVHAYQPETPPTAQALSAGDAGLGMSYSWELERALADGLLQRGETVLACAFGTGEGSLVARPVLGSPASMSALGSVLAGVVDDRPPSRSELFLTDRRLLHVERDAGTLALLSQAEIPLERLPRLKQVNGVLILGRFELLPDPAHPDMAREFVRRYRGLVTERFDPFGDLSVTDGAAPVTTGRPDPFSSVLEHPLNLDE